MMSGMLVASLSFGGGYLPAHADTTPDLDEAFTVESFEDNTEVTDASLLDTVLEDETVLEDITEPAPEPAEPAPVDGVVEPEPVPAPIVDEPEAPEPVVEDLVVPEPRTPALTPPPEDVGADRDPLMRTPYEEPLDAEGRVASDSLIQPLATPAPNPPLPNQCGVSVAIVLDLSGSLSNSDVNNSKIAARAVVTALEGTPSSVGVYSFATRGNRVIAKTAVASSAGANSVRSAITNVSRPSDSWTNWDEPLRMVHEDNANYDIVLFVTDGHPNRYGTGQTGGSLPLDRAIEAANVLKASGTTMLGVGVGGINVANIQAISGPGSYYTVANYGELTALVTGLAEEDCRGTVSVVKETRDANGDLSLAGGWDFTSSILTDGGTITPTVGTTDPSNGAVNFDVIHPTADTAVVQFTETQKPGFILEQQGGFNALCRDNTTQEAIPVTNIGEAGWQMTVGRTQVVSCNVINQEMSLYEPLTVEKTASGSFDILYDWSIDKWAENDSYTSISGSSVDVGYSVDVTQESRTMTAGSVSGDITITNPNDRDMVATVSDTLSSGQQCTLGGVSDVDPVSPGIQINVGPGSMTVPYSCDLSSEPAALADTNTVTLSWDRAVYPQTQAQFQNPGTAGTGTATHSAPFTYVVNETDRTVTISDSQLPDTWTVTWDQAGGVGFVHSNTYTLSKTVDAGTCEVFGNIAEILDTGASSEANVTVCAGADLEITKTTAQSFVRTYQWDIEKTALGSGPYVADPATGDVTVDYSVTVTPGGYLDSAWMMSGVITVENPNDWQDVAVTVTDDADFGQGVQCVVTGVVGDTSIVDADPSTPGFQTTIPSASIMEFEYSCTFTEQPNYEGVNTAVVTWDGNAASTEASQSTYDLDVAQDDWTMTPLNQNVTITDSHYTFLIDWEMNQGDGPQTRTYSVIWNVGEAGTCASFTNTATLTGVDNLYLTDDETIQACRQAELLVDKTANATYDRLHEWEIDKRLPDGDHFGQVVDEFGNATFDYIVDVNTTGYVDSGWSLDGDITITNPNDYAAVIATVTDTTTIAGAVCTVDAAADIDTSVDGVQVSVPASGSVTVGYTCDLPDLVEADYANHTNTATVTFGDGQSVSSAPVDIDFALDAETDATVDVIDDKTDPANPVTLGTVSITDTLPTTFEYSVDFTAPAGECTNYTNTAWVVTDGDDPQDSLTVIVCDQEDLTVFKTVTAEYDRTYDWSITKDADQTHVEVAGDDTASVTYTVEAIASDPIDTGKSVSGMIRMTNPNDEVGPIEATLSDDISIPGATCVFDGTDANPSVDGFQVILDDDDVLEIDYTCTVPADTDVDGDYTNTVTLTWGVDESVSFTEAFTFSAATTTNDTVSVTDTMPSRAPETIELGTASVADSPVSFTYTEELDVVPGECVVYDNTAGITETQSAATETVTVCGGADLEVAKNVITSFDRTYLWDIDKSVNFTRVDADPETGIATFDYTVTATPQSAPNGWEDSGWVMSGEITVTNPNDWLDIEATVTDVVDIGGGAICQVTGGTDVLIPQSDSVVLDYACVFTSQPAYDGTNTATVTWDDSIPTPTHTATGTATVAAGDWDQTPINDTVTVIDDKTDPANPVTLGEATWNADGTPTVFTYSLDLEGVPGTCVDFTNTAWISQTAQQAGVDVTACYRLPLEIDKTVDASYDRTYLWDIEKSAEDTEIDVDSATGEAIFSYVVHAIPSGYVDSGWEMSGEITVTNPNDFESVVVDVTDSVDVGGGAICSVSDGEGVTVEAGATVTLDYECQFDTEPEYQGTNTAIVTTDGGEFTDDVEVTFDLDMATDESVVVMDDKTDPANPIELGVADWNADGVPVEFTYDVTHIGVPGQCVDFTNTAWLELEEGDLATELITTLCVSLDLDVEKTVDATFDRAYHWDIAKSVDRTSVTVSEEEGEAEFAYVVEAIPDGYTDSDWAMSGEITVTNPNRYHPVTVTVEDLTDIPGVICTVTDGVDASVGPDSSMTFTYDCDFKEAEEHWYSAQNVARVTSGEELFTDLVFLDFEIDNETDHTVTVMDDKTDPENQYVLGLAEWNADGVPVEFPYTVTHVGVPGQCVIFTNNAWLDAGEGEFLLLAMVEPFLDEGATVDVELCVESPLVVDLADDVIASYDREYLWDIEKDVNHVEVVLKDGGNALLHYVVAAIPDGYEDSGHELQGTLTLTNPNTHVEPVVTIESTVSFDGVICEVQAIDIDPAMDGIQVIVPAQVDDEPGTLTLDYTCAGEPDTYSGSVSATATYLDFHEAEQMTTATRAVDYEIDEEINKAVTVLDDKTNPADDPVVLGTATWNPEGTPTEFEYTLEFEGVPGKTVEYTNTAWIKETDDKDSVTVKVTAHKPIIPVKPAHPKVPTPGPTLPRTGVDNAAWLLAIGGISTILGSGLYLGTKRREEE